MATQPTPPPPAYFLSLSLENVRSFGDKQTISFARPDGRPAQWTIILGDNGVGKTTVLKALAIIKPTPMLGTNLYLPSADRINNNSWLLARGSGQPWAHVDPPMHIDYEVSSGYLLNEKIDKIGPDYEIRFSVITPVLRATKMLISETIVELAHESGGYSTPPLAIGGLNCYGYGAGRTVGNSTISENPTADTCASLFDDRADLLNPEEWFLFADYRMAKDKDPLTTQNFHLLRAALLKVMEEGEVTDIEVGPVAPGGGSPRQGVQFKTPYGWVRLREMSLGYQTLVVWLTDLASKLFLRYPDSPNPLAEPAIVLIDEIDLHLHPSWQRKLIGFLSDIFPNTQFIATAHSPLVVQAAGDEGANVVLLRREGDQTVVVSDLPDVHAWRIEQILNSELFDTSPLSPQTEADLERRNALRLKKRLTAKEKTELARLDAEVSAQPLGNTLGEQRAGSLLERLAQHLNANEG